MQRHEWSEGWSEETTSLGFAPRNLGKRNRLPEGSLSTGCESRDVQTPRSQRDSDQDSSTGSSGPMPIANVEYWLFVAVGLGRFFFFFLSLGHRWECDRAVAPLLQKNSFIQIIIYNLLLWRPSGVQGYWVLSSFSFSSRMAECIKVSSTALSVFSLIELSWCKPTIDLYLQSPLLREALPVFKHGPLTLNFRNSVRQRRTYIRTWDVLHTDKRIK